MTGRPPLIYLLCLSLLFSVCCDWVKECEATLFVYRMDGEDAPPPEFSDEWDVAYAALPWSDLDEEHFGVAHRLDMSQSSLGPVGIEEGVNRTPLVNGTETSPSLSPCERKDPHHENCLGPRA
jgi:hypothetical protein